jgi:hypothetical protein
MNAIARAERDIAARETSNARDLAVDALVALEMTEDRPLTPEEFGDIQRRITEAKNYLHSAGVRVRRAYRREQTDARRSVA